MAPTGEKRRGASVFDDFMRAIADKHGQFDIHLQRWTLKVPGLSQAFEMNGTATVAVHMRDLTEREKQAHVDRSLQRIKS